MRKEKAAAESPGTLSGVKADEGEGGDLKFRSWHNVLTFRRVTRSPCPPTHLPWEAQEEEGGGADEVVCPSQ